jgi:hypothetical protein
VVVEGDSNLTLGTTTSSYTPAVNFIRFQGGLTNGWNSLDAYNINTTLMIRANFGPTSILVGNNEPMLISKKNELIVYPNPSADGVFTIESSSISGVNSLLRVYNSAGRIVQPSTMEITEGKAKIDLSAEHIGMYFLEWRIGEKVMIKKLVFR